MLKFFLAVFLLFGYLSAQAATSDQDMWSSGLKSRIDHLVKKSGVPAEQLSILVTTETLNKQIEIFQLNKERKRIPASLTKVVAAGATLKNLPADHKFVTKLVSDAAIKGGELKGDLFLVGGGNPSFTSENLWDLVNEFTRSGVKTITGNIVVDDNHFDRVRFDPSREQQRVNRAYDAPVGAMSFNWNSANVYVRPGRKKGDKAEIFVDPLNEYIEFENRVTTKSAGRARVNVERKSLGGKKEKWVITGSIGANQSEFVKYVSVMHPDYWSGYHLKSFLNQRGIQLKGKVKTGNAPAGASMLSDHESKPLFEIVKDMMKFSNNYVAEMLTKNLGRERKLSSKNHMEAGMGVLRDYLKKEGINETQFKIFNPSGLTRDNRFTAASLEKLMGKLRGQFVIFPEFLASLPISGIDGTLKSRLKGPSSKGWMRAKTGRLSGVVGLAGYVKSHRYPLFTYIFIYNGSNQKMNEAIRLADDIAYSLINES